MRTLNWVRLEQHGRAQVAVNPKPQRRFPNMLNPESAPLRARKPTSKAGFPRLHAETYVSLRAHIYIFIHIYICICVYVYMYIYIYASIYMCWRVYFYIHRCQRETYTCTLRAGLHRMMSTLPSMAVAAAAKFLYAM